MVVAWTRTLVIEVMRGGWVTDNHEGVAERVNDRLDVTCKRMRVKDNPNFWSSQ